MIFRRATTSPPSAVSRGGVGQIRQVRRIHAAMRIDPFAESVMNHQISRRTFHRAGTLAGFGWAAMKAPAVAARLGANDRIRLGFIGVANRGGQLLDAFMTHQDMEIVALCDVDQRTLARAKQKVGSPVQTYTDFRELYDRQDMDAVVIATPDHWHAVQTVMACDAGKDVYVEKPLSITVHEGRRMVEAARRNQRVVQVGTHRRSSSLYAALAGRVQADDFGKICVSRAYRLSNMYPEGIGKAAPQAPPAELNWDMWLGPRPEQPYRETIAPYRFRWWQLYSSQMANWGVHFLDAIRWCTGELAPASVCAIGGRYAIDDDRTIPDTMEATFEFASGRLAVFGQYESSGNPAFPHPGEVELRGTRGTVYVSERGYLVVPERGGQFQDRERRMKSEEVQDRGGNANLTAQHARNFLDCMRSREKPNADVEIGHRSTTMSLIANISLVLRQRLDWDAERERFTNSEEANAMLHYEYRKPWKLG
jgi:predicted dehydrogenase